MKIFTGDQIDLASISVAVATVDYKKRGRTNLVKHLRDAVSMLNQYPKLVKKLEAKNNALRELCTCTDGGGSSLQFCMACKYRNGE